MAKTSREKKAKVVDFAAQMVGKAESSVMLILLSNVGDNIKNILTSQREVFQYTTFILTTIGVAISSAKLAFAANKNLGKVQNLLLATAKLAVAGVMTFGAITFAPVVTTSMFFTLMAIDTLTATGKAIYFGVKAYTAHSKEEKEFFKEKATQNGTGAIIGGILITAFAVTIIAAPYVGLSVAAAIGIVGGVIAGSLVLYGIGKAIHQTFFQKKKSETHQEKPEKENDLKSEDEKVTEKEDSLTAAKTLKAELTYDQPRSTYAQLENSLGKAELTPDSLITPVEETVMQPEKTGFFAYLITPQKSLEEVVTAIDAHIKKIKNEELEDTVNKSLWSQTAKRENKINALSFLNELLNKSSNGIEDRGEINVTNQTFEYENTEDLIKQIDKYVIKTYPGVYQSFFKNTGKVEDLFQQAYQVLRDKSLAPEKTTAIPPEVTQNHSTENSAEKPKLM